MHAVANEEISLIDTDHYTQPCNDGLEACLSGTI